MSTKLETAVVKLTSSQEVVFKYLEDFNNLDQLLPRDRISDWEADFDSCSFKIQNAATIALNKDSVEPNSKINIVGGEGVPFKFTLVAYINEDGDGCTAQLVFDGDINPFLKMMVVKPLQNLFDFMAERLVRVHGK